MKQILGLLALVITFTGCKNENREDQKESKSQVKQAAEKVEKDRLSDRINIQPISHSTAVITWDDTVIYLDPVGGADSFEDHEKPDFILITDIHGDHMSVETLKSMNLEGVNIIVPQEVKDELPGEFNEIVRTIKNGGATRVLDFYIEAVPMYNLPEDDPESRHPKGRGNGYILEKDGKRLYIAGDTEDIPEMRALKNIDIALIPMNMPYTMTVEQAAEAVLAFKPKQVYPYHYRGQDGLADVSKFKSLVNEGDEDIEVIQLNWYPNRE